MPELTETDPHQIYIKGARVHNLKNIDIAIPRDQMIVITGLSGSGKSSLAFDTLYAEGQRRYVESLSAYASQFLGRIDKPDVDYIHGIPPAIAIEQRVNTRNPRSTVGTSTEIYDYLKLLFARLGKTYSPVSGNEVRKHSVSDVVNYITSFAEGEKIFIMAPFLCCDGTTVKYQLDIFLKQGINRIEIDGEQMSIEELLDQDSDLIMKSPGQNIIIDRLSISKDEDSLARYADSVQTAFSIGKGICGIKNPETKAYEEFSDRFEADGISVRGADGAYLQL